MQSACPKAGHSSKKSNKSSARKSKKSDEFGNSTVDSIKPFGYDLFASDPSTFAPGNEVPIPSDYRIGPGDVVEIQLFGQRNESLQLGYIPRRYDSLSRDRSRSMLSRRAQALLT